MKRVVVLLICLVFAVSAFAFEQGTKYIGGGLGFESYRMDSDSDPVNAIEIMPWGGYFVIDNVSVDVVLNYVNASSGEWDGSISEFTLGLGGTYYFNKFYGGLGLMMASSNNKMNENNEFKHSANYMGLFIGYLYPIVENVYLDTSLMYQMGIGKYGGDSEDFDNEESGLDIAIGLSVFFK
jgi:hypothetical protein